MKTMGLLGGMSWESTETYYRLINEGVRARLGGLHSAELILYSVDFARIETLQSRGDWAAAAEILGAAARSVERSGAEFLVLCTNTMHRVAETIEASIAVPLVHIADAAATALLRQGVTRVGLIGTRFTMEQVFYRDRLEAHGITVLVPDEAGRDRVHAVIYDELCRGIVRPASKAAYLEVVAGLADRGAQGVILGCTEIGLLIQAADTPVRLFDTTAIHADEAVRYALAEAPEAGAGRA